jgi:RAD51-like protein 2
MFVSVCLHASCGYYYIVFASNFFEVKILFQVKIVIVDSVTFHFRQDFDDMALRTRLLSGMALKLMKLAKAFSLAVRINLVCS